MHTTSPNKKIVELFGIRKTRDRNAKLILDNLDFSVFENDYISIQGTSGCGKSTLLQIIGLLDKPDEGTYILDKELVSGKNSQELAIIRNKKIGYIFQSFYLIQNQTILENIALPLIYRGIEKKEALDQASILLSSLNLFSKGRRFPNELSGGQQQRIAIARALAGKPVLILADEPTGSLDFETGQNVLSILEEIISREGTSVVLVTHDATISRRASRKIEMHYGGLIER